MIIQKRKRYTLAQAHSITRVANFAMHSRAQELEAMDPSPMNLHFGAMTL